MAQYKYAEYPYAILYEDANGAKGDDKIHQLIFGDWIKINEPVKKSGEYIYVHCRGRDGWIKENELRDDRVLEVVFVDVGQGDGCHVVTPDDRHMLIDAGVSDNMYRYLKWRFAGFRNEWTFDELVISHPDMDHYLGFQKLAEEPNVFFENLYHNGLFEYRDGLSDSGLGEVDTRGRKLYTSIIDSKQKVKEYLEKRENWEHPTRPQYNKKYGTLHKTLHDNNKVKNEVRVPEAGSYLPNYEAGKEVSIKVLAPVFDKINGTRGLRDFLSSKGKTKNGHSIVFKLEIGDISILLGGDLNIPSENFLMEHYTGLDTSFRGAREENEFIEVARQTFECDIAKSCHHGSADFSSLFLKCLNPAVTVISSGDEESHSHPRPDTLGAIGVHGRGERPLIFSTELARSHRETENKTRDAIVEERIKLVKARTEKRKKEIQEKIDDLYESLLRRNVTVYGAINVRTDGEKCIIAQKLEKGSGGKRWDIYKIEKGRNGKFKYNSKHEH